MTPALAARAKNTNIATAKYSLYKIKWKERVGDFQYVKKIAYRSRTIGGFLRHFVLDKDGNDKIRNAKEDDGIHRGEYQRTDS